MLLIQAGGHLPLLCTELTFNREGRQTSVVFFAPLGHLSPASCFMIDGICVSWLELSKTLRVRGMALLALSPPPENTCVSELLCPKTGDWPSLLAGGRHRTLCMVWLPCWKCQALLGLDFHTELWEARRRGRYTCVLGSLLLIVRADCF